MSWYRFFPSVIPQVHSRDKLLTKVEVDEGSARDNALLVIESLAGLLTDLAELFFFWVFYWGLGLLKGGKLSHVLGHRLVILSCLWCRWIELDPRCRITCFYCLSANLVCVCAHHPAFEMSLLITLPGHMYSHCQLTRSTFAGDQSSSN